MERTVYTSLEVGDNDIPEVGLSTTFMQFIPQTSSEISAIKSPSNGMVVYDSTVDAFVGYSGNWDASFFGMSVDTTKAGSSSKTMIIPLVSGETYDFLISWGDGAIETFTGTTLTNATHIYDEEGIYPIAINGAFPRIFFNNGGDRLKLLDITNWGNGVWSSMNSAFEGCANLTGSFTDAPDLSNVTNCAQMFRNCSVFNADVSLWSTGNITSFNSSFVNCTLFTSDLSGWNTGSITNLAFMLSNCSSFNTDFSSWQIQNLTSAASWLNGTSFSTSNYDLLLNAWSLLTVNSGVLFGATATNYTIATSQAARDVLTNAPNLWVITDAGGV